MELLSPVPGLHMALAARRRQQQSLFTDLGSGARALSTRADVHIRQQLAGLAPEEAALPPALPNTDLAVYSQAREQLAAFRRDRDRLPCPVT
jgi:hypothetical protein